ncbi:MAG: UDP-N-acetylglucosamine--N-acetylmuramyl-(pentapeptide) pyrophosphoryl-undecaprenol N-acetylglucosamine transferase [Planctomycetes bacterium]|nr:UDP-N-acetylglucosamine--N-acetylmuramyl-(pentapeptide) pyrophosphoryl-undecaprenol N-acetylglucosamine transferase [Planctomycetota bacterium]
MAGQAGNNPIFIFAGGGTGGHIYPGLAVAEELVKLLPSARIVFACSNRQIDRNILYAQPFAIVSQPVRPLPRSIGGLAGFLKAWMASMRQGRAMIIDLKPAAVLGLGGFAAGPVVRQAHKRGVRAGLLNPDAIPGRANKYLAWRSDAIFTQFESTAGEFSAKVSGRIHCVGCPIRPGLIRGDKQEALRHFNLRPDRKTLLAFGASLGAESINGAMQRLAGELAAHAGIWQVLHFSGAGKGGGLTEAYSAAGLHAMVAEYCSRMELAYAAADLTLCRGGAVTVAELAATGVPAVILPYPYHKDRQQWHNSRQLAEAGAALIVDDLIEPAANAQSLRAKLLPLLADSQALQRMRQSAKSVAKPDAAASVAAWLAGG